MPQLGVTVNLGWELDHPFQECFKRHVIFKENKAYSRTKKGLRARTTGSECER